MQQQIKDVGVANGTEELRQKIEEIAIRMLKEGYGMNMASRATGLSMEQVATLKNKL